MREQMKLDVLRIIRNVLRIMRFLIPDYFRRALTRSFSKRFVNKLSGEATDKFLEFLLTIMDVCFLLSEDYRKNIEGFSGSYVFKAKERNKREGRVEASATFENGDMKVHKTAINNYDVMITFKDPKSLRSFLLSKDQEILDHLLENTVEIDGNLNYIYKFGFMARDLKHRLVTL